MNEKGKGKIVKAIIASIAIFAFGIFVGYEINFGSISSIQGYLFNAVGEATDSNASDSNASDANASDANASDANATDCNANDPTKFDDVLYISNFDITLSSAKVGQKVPLKFVTYGADSVGASIIFKKVDSDDEFTAQVKNLNKANPYITIPNTAVRGTYKIKNIMATGRNSNGTTFTKTYNSSSVLALETFKKEITVIKDESKLTSDDVILSSLTVDQTSASNNDKVYVKYKVDKELKSLKLVFAKDDVNMSVFVKDLNNKSYFVIPSTAKSGTYTLKSATFVTKNATTVYTRDGAGGSAVYDFNSTIDIKATQTSSFVLNNNEITSETIKDLYSANDDTEITIDTDASTLVDSEIFAAIKGTNRKLIINYNDNQIIFNGKDVKKVKSVDTSIIVDLISETDDISKLVSKGIVVNFADNGELPGKALVRIKENSDIKNELQEKVNIYYYDANVNKFNEIATEVKKTDDGYYEFVITHNSDYIMVNEKLSKNLIAEPNDGKVVSFQKSKKVYLLLIALAVVVIAAVVVVIVVLKKKQKKNNTVVTTEENIVEPVNTIEEQPSVIEDNNIDNNSDNNTNI